MQQGPPRLRRARPVGDAPIDPLLLATEDLAKGWLLALLEQAPLGEAPAILAADLARDGPLLCDAVVRALVSDGDLRRLEPGGALEWLAGRVGEICGAGAAEDVSRAVDALAALIWSALREELVRPESEQVSELAERLALVIERVRRAALSAGSKSEPSMGRPRVHAVPTPEPELAEADEAGPPPAALWIGALHEELDRARGSGGSLSLLLVELEEADRIAVAAPGPEIAFGRFAQAVRSAIRRQDILACETEARSWIIARDTGRAGADALSTRIATAVASGHAWQGAPMTVSVGIAVYGEDGADAAGLIDSAERSRFAASASGLVISAAAPEDADPVRES